MRSVHDTCRRVGGSARRDAVTQQLISPMLNIILTVVGLAMIILTTWALYHAPDVDNENNVDPNQLD
jgi:hypothetical protein